MSARSAILDDPLLRFDKASERCTVNSLIAIHKEARAMDTDGLTAGKREQRRAGVSAQCRAVMKEIGRFDTIEHFAERSPLNAEPVLKDGTDKKRVSNLILCRIADRCNTMAFGYGRQIDFDDGPSELPDGEQNHVQMIMNAEDTVNVHDVLRLIRGPVLALKHDSGLSAGERLRAEG